MSKRALQEVSSASRSLLDPLGTVSLDEQTVTDKQIEEFKTPDPAAAPAPVKESVMPIADSEEIKKKKRRSIAEQKQRQGRASTFMTSNDSLGAA